MHRQPNDSWRWYYDDEHKRLMLDFADGTLFCSRFASKSLIADALQPAMFTVDEVSLYDFYHEQCQRLNLTMQQQAELVLNALAARHFLKPQMPKSWYFAVQQTDWQPASGDIASVWLTDNLQEVHLLVVESGDHASLCVLAQPQLDLGRRVIQLGDAIKIMHDRLLPLSSQWQQNPLSQAG